MSPRLSSNYSLLHLFSYDTHYYTWILFQRETITVILHICFFYECFSSPSLIEKCLRVHWIFTCHSFKFHLIARDNNITIDIIDWNLRFKLRRGFWYFKQSTPTFIASNRKWFYNVLLSKTFKMNYRSEKWNLILKIENNWATPF